MSNNYFKYTYFPIFWYWWPLRTYTCIYTEIVHVENYLVVLKVAAWKYLTNIGLVSIITSIIPPVAVLPKTQETLGNGKPC